MKKTLLMIILVLLVILPVFSSDVSAEGYGSTKVEATENAKRALAEKIFPVLVSGTVTTSSSSSGGSSFSSESTSQVIGLLSFIDTEDIALTNQQKKKNNYGVRAIIRDDESTVSHYSDKAMEAKKNTEFYYNKTTSGTVDDIVENYKKTLSYYLEYNNYKTILTRIGHGSVAPELSIDKTYSIIQSEYASALTMQANELDDLRFSDQVEEARKKTEALIKQNQKELEAVKAQTNDALLQEQMLWEAQVQEKMNSFLNSSVGVSASTVSNPTYADFYDMSKKLMEAIENFNDLCDEYESMIASEKQRIEKAIANEAQAIRKKEYKKVYTKNGEPTQEAKAEREEEVNAMIRDRQNELANNLKFIDSNFQPLIRNSYQSLASSIENLEKTQFADSTFGSRKWLTVSYPKNTWDGTALTWKLSLAHNGIKGFSKEFYLAYGDVTGNYNPVKGADYEATFNTYDNLLISGDYWLKRSITLKYTVTVQNNGFLVHIDSASLQLYDASKTKPLFDSVQPFLISQELSVKDVSGYDWLKSSPKVASLYNKKKTSSTAKTTTTTTSTTKATTTTAKTASTSTSKTSSSKTTKKLTGSFVVRMNLGITAEFSESSSSSGSGSSSEKDETLGYLMSVDLYYKLGSGFFGVGLAPYYWNAGHKVNLLGTDILCVLEWNPTSHDGVRFYSDARFGFVKGSLNYCVTLFGTEMQSITVGMGIIGNGLFDKARFFLSGGLWIGN